MNQIVAMSIAGAAVGFMTGEMQLKNGMSAAILGAAIGMGIGYLYTSIGDVVVPAGALTSGQSLAALSAPIYAI
ncbi:MAG: hypothetical protein M0Z94_00930 [Dehalococcoidales bacterium]|nr:hypothetical protein [Dehalococcoidales bacterium]